MLKKFLFHVFFIKIFLARIFFVCLVCLFFTQILYAARPMNTDDARVIPAGHCQMESWGEFDLSKSSIRNGMSDSTMWALPSCNFIFDTEITLGGHIGLQSYAMQYQLKKLFVDADKRDWGIGIALGNTYNWFINSNNLNNLNKNLYFYIPATILFFDSKLVLHGNLGYHLQDFKDAFFIAGLGFEVAITQRFYVIGEVFYMHRNFLKYQLGFRTWIVQDTLQLDSTYGNDFQNNGSYVSLGLRILSFKLL